MKNNDNELKQKFDGFVNDYNNMGKAIAEISPLFDKFMNSINNESTITASVEKYCGFLKIEAESKDAQDETEVERFKKSLFDSKQKLDIMVKELNECKNGLHVSPQYLSEITSQFKSNIGEHLANINKSITSTNPYLSDYVVKEEKVDDVMVQEEPKNIVPVEEENKVVAIEEQPKEMVPVNVQTDSLDELSKSLDNELAKNTQNINELKETANIISTPDFKEVDQDSVPFNFDELNFPETQQLEDKKELEPVIENKEEDTDFSLNEFFNENKPVDDENKSTDDDGFIKVTDIQEVGAPEETNADNKDQTLERTL